jgi:uncharacterized protein (TIGR02453 family)
MLEPKALAFLRELKENNDREWFQPRRDEYETVLRGPMMAAVEAVNQVLPPEYVTDPAKSVYRIYRDTRFSADKTPYKTHVGALLWHRQLGKNGGAALYFHLSTDEFLIAGGLYHCPNDRLLQVRNHIATEHAALTKLLRRKAVRELFGGIQGSKLTRPPKGFDPAHPAVEYLKMKDLLLESSMPADVAFRADAGALLRKHFVELLPFVEFLNVPLLKTASKRDPLLRGD